MPSPELLARARALLNDPGTSEEAKARARARLAEMGLEDVAEAPKDGGWSVNVGEARVMDEPVQASTGGPGGSIGGGGSPYEELAPPGAAPPSAGAPGTPVPPPSSRADDVLGALGGLLPYGRALLHGADRSMAFGLGTTLGEAVDPGTRARGETAAKEHPLSELAGMVGGALMPGGASRRVTGMAGSLAPFAIKGAGAAANMGRGALAGGASAAVQDIGEDVVAGRPVEGAGRAAAVGGLLGGALSGLGSVTKWVQDRVRDPAEQLGRDIASAEKIGGSTAVLSGVTKGPAYEAAERAARASTAAGKPVSPAGVAEQRAVPELGKAVQGDIDARLGAMGAENASMGDEAAVSLQPVLDKSLGRLRRMMRDQKALPGMSTRGLASTVKQSADIEIVDITSDAVERADPENILEAGEAAAMGLIKRSGDLTNKAVILTPRMVSPRELEDIRGAFDAAGKVSPTNVKAAGDVANARAVAGAAREARMQLGPEAIDRAGRHEKSLGEMENVINAAGLPQGARKVDPSDLATSRGLAGAVRNYRTRGNEGAGVDEVLDQLAGQGPLRVALDEAAGVAATQRLRDASKIPLSSNGLGSYGLKDAASLRADAMMRYLGNAVPTTQLTVPALGSSAATRRQRK